ncbi:MAG TPA: hypothetical protein VFA43_22650 [Gemmatimonadaceae bacterium]|nr:hypothetical protein [Gemmatimonadaceae bacterium]
MRRLTTVALVGGTLGLGAMGVLGQPNVPPPTHLGGAYWKQLNATEKDAYLAGFLAGAAAEQARAAATAIDTLRAQGTLRYRYAPHVYAAQIDDFYWWQDRVSVPLVDAMVQINGTLDDQQRR